MFTHQTSPSDMPKYLQEVQLPEEFKDLILSLPKENGWIMATQELRLYQGFWLSIHILPGLLAWQKQFESQDTDVLFISIPKSGTTWLKAILFSLVNRSVYTDLNKHPLLTTNPHDLLPSILLDLPTLSSSSPRLIFSHTPYVCLPESVKSSTCKIVYLCRNPKDVFVSLWHYANKLRAEGSDEHSLEEAFDKFCRGVSPCGPIWDHSLEYWKESLERPEKVLFLHYEEMRRDPVFHVRRLAEFIGCPFSKEEEANNVVENILKLCSFDNMRNLEVNKKGKLSCGKDNKVFFRRGEVGDWGNYLTAEMAEKLDSVVEEKLHGSGLKFKFDFHPNIIAFQPSV